MQNVDRNAIDPIKDAVASGAISISTANVIAQLNEEEQEELAAGDLSKVKPREIKQAAAPKVDTSSNIDAEQEPVRPVPENGKKHSQEFNKLLNWAQSLTHEQIDFLCDSGWYNNTIEGYLIAAAKEADFSKTQIDNLLHGLQKAFCKKSKADVESILQYW